MINKRSPKLTSQSFQAAPPEVGVSNIGGVCPNSSTILLELRGVAIVTIPILFHRITQKWDVQNVPFHSLPFPSIPLWLPRVPQTSPRRTARFFTSAKGWAQAEMRITWSPAPAEVMSVSDESYTSLRWYIHDHPWSSMYIMYIMKYKDSTYAIIYIYYHVYIYIHIYIYMYFYGLEKRMNCGCI